MSGRTVTLVWLSVALSALTHGAAAAGDGGCLPDQACEGGLTVRYGSVNAECNRDMDKKVVASAPSLHIKGNSQTQGDLLLVMVDPDAPSPDSCPDKYWLHWLAQVKVKDGEVKVQKTLKGYYPPTPPEGTHRYQLLVYKLTGDVASSHVPSGRSGFDLAQFKSGAGLGDTVASFQFTVKS